MKTLPWGIACACLLPAYGASMAATDMLATDTPAPALISGIDIQYIDDSVRAQDDFYQHVNGKWLASTVIPPDKGRYGSFDKLTDDAQDQLRSIVEGLQTVRG